MIADRVNLDRILNLCFHKHVTSDGEVIYYRDCCLPDCRPDEQGYIWVYADGMTVHSYFTPEKLCEFAKDPHQKQVDK